MAKLIFVPEWLQETLHESGKSINEKNIMSAIISKYDVINYQKSQIEFFKFINGFRCNNIEAFIFNFNQLMRSPLSDLEEVSIYMEKHYHCEANLEMINCYPIFDDRTIVDSSKYVINISSDNKIAYIIGGSAVSNPLNALPVFTVPSNRISIITAVLDKAYNGFRIITENTDRSSVFRENSYLTQLYVRNLCNM